MKLIMGTLVVLLSGCGQGVGATPMSCAEAQAKVRAAWKSPPDKISGDTWIYVEDGVGTFNYRFELGSDGNCRTTTYGSIGN